MGVLEVLIAASTLELMRKHPQFSKELGLEDRSEYPVEFKDYNEIDTRDNKVDLLKKKEKEKNYG